jgi:hypothetical protein
MTPQQELKKIKADFQKKIEALAERVRDEMVVPKCGEHDLHFVSGMGTYFFAKNTSAAAQTIDSQDDALMRRYGLGRVFEVLYLEVMPNDFLGTYVRDVR